MIENVAPLIFFDCCGSICLFLELNLLYADKISQSESTGFLTSMMVNLRVCTESALAAVEGFQELMKGGARHAELTHAPRDGSESLEKIFFISAIVDHESAALAFLKKHDFDDDNL